MSWCGLSSRHGTPEAGYPWMKQDNVRLMDANSDLKVALPP